MKRSLLIPLLAGAMSLASGCIEKDLDTLSRTADQTIETTRKGPTPYERAVEVAQNPLVAAGREEPTDSESAEEAPYQEPVEEATIPDRIPNLGSQWYLFQGKEKDGIEISGWGENMDGIYFADPKVLAEARAEGMKGLSKLTSAGYVVESRTEGVEPGSIHVTYLQFEDGNSLEAYLHRNRNKLDSMGGERIYINHEDNSLATYEIDLNIETKETTSLEQPKRVIGVFDRFEERTGLDEHYMDEETRDLGKSTEDLIRLAKN